MVGKMLTEVTEQNFDEEVLNSNLPVFACFTTSWCSSCFPTCFVAVGLVNRYDGQIKFVRIDRGKVPEISDEYHITIVPSVILFQDSQMIKRLLGYQEKVALGDLLDALLAGVEAPINVLEEHVEGT